ncbi:MAG: hypothetical protein WD011_07135, partial [Nitriliruptoraceae bacterium]
PAMPDHVEDQQIIDGLYRFRPAGAGSLPAHILASGTLIHEALRAQHLLADDWDVAADVWSAPGWNRLLRNGFAAESWNRTNPDAEERVPDVTRILKDNEGPHVAVSDWMRATPFQIADWVPGPFAVLGTDGFGRSDTREALRRFHRVDAESIAYCVLAELVKMDSVDHAVLADAMGRYDLDFERIPFFGQPTLTDDVTQ